MTGAVISIFSELPNAYRAGVAPGPVSYYFSINEIKRTVFLTQTGCEVLEGKQTDNADCVCKMEEDLFLKIWHEGYLPGLKDFLTGAIKSNNPEALKTFLAVFGKGA